MIFTLLVFFVAILAGGIAGMSGFGIGSLLTPLLATKYSVKLAVAMVSVPHLIATAARFYGLRRHLDWRVFLNFGILSAAGGLLGALLNAKANSPVLAMAFGALLMFAGISGLTGIMERVHFGRRAAWVAGASSGFFGGLVGNQGGIRSAALLGFDIRKESMVATATAVGLMVDAARMPVYLTASRQQVFGAWPVLIISVAGALLGTFWGVRILRQIPEKAFRSLLFLLILVLGIYMLIHGTMLQGAK